MNNIKMTEYKKSGIYCILNLSNSQIYIGSSKDIYTRLRRHLSDLNHNRHHNQHIQNSFNKRGLDSFYSFILEYVEDEELIDREEYWISILKPEYNKVLTDLKRPAVSYDLDTRKRISIGVKKAHEAGLLHGSDKEIFVYGLNGSFIEKFSKRKDCLVKYKIGGNSLDRALKEGDGQTMGFQFRYNYSENIGPILINSSKASLYKNRHNLIIDPQFIRK